MTSPEVLCNELPPQLIVLLKYVRNLYFDSKPDYEYMRKELESVLESNYLTNDKVFCWNTV
jgi:casein kinase I homolog HRR25